MSEPEINAITWPKNETQPKHWYFKYKYEPDGGGCGCPNRAENSELDGSENHHHRSESACDYAVLFSVKDSARDLACAIKTFSDLEVPVKHLETRRATVGATQDIGGLDVYARTAVRAERIEDLTKKLRQITPEGFKDAEYRKRRNYFTEVALNYKQNVIYRELTKLYETHACKEYRENLKLLEQHAGYCESDLPQLEDISNYLKSRTGFTVRPVAGYLSARDFLSGLAFRVFYSTQYIRHPSDPMYTPEPDCCHEILGHMPLLADPSFARFSHEMGLASLGASDEEVKKLATCYFFTIEFGLCRQNGQLRAYGAGLLSSIAELKHALSDKAVIQPFIPSEVMKKECLVTTFQEGYFETPSFEDATNKMRQFAQTIKRPFDVLYDPYTQSVEVVDKPDKTRWLIERINYDLSLLKQTLDKASQSVNV
ncbi:unnamed protein product [Echinostoma caproni]|uniref:BH4_AAA_HYDROXYL_2 domain-containing protein n=1 Tax=Echinostoma caproni TaxID=27848 RepID=A0A183AAN5_9TREM|nr:unnamed protein product [Echinostoma caproni]